MLSSNQKIKHLNCEKFWGFSFLFIIMLIINLFLHTFCMTICLPQSYIIYLYKTNTIENSKAETTTAVFENLLKGNFIHTKYQPTGVFFILRIVFIFELIFIFEAVFIFEVIFILVVVFIFVFIFGVVFILGG